MTHYVRNNEQAGQLLRNCLKQHRLQVLHLLIVATSETKRRYFESQEASSISLRRLKVYVGRVRGDNDKERPQISTNVSGPLHDFVHTPDSHRAGSFPSFQICIFLERPPSWLQEDRSHSPQFPIVPVNSSVLSSPGIKCLFLPSCISS